MRVMGNGSKNLELARGPKSVWDEPGWQASLSSYDRQRLIAGASGVVLAITGARRGGFGGGLAATAGAVLAVRAAMGHHDFGTARDLVYDTLVRAGWREHDRVQDASEESFPASDSPSWTTTTGSNR
jgi:hypothetical protein